MEMLKRIIHEHAEPKDRPKTIRRYAAEVGPLPIVPVSRLAALVHDGDDFNDIAFGPIDNAEGEAIEKNPTRATLKNRPRFRTGKNEFDLCVDLDGKAACRSFAARLVPFGCLVDLGFSSGVIFEAILRQRCFAASRGPHHQEPS